MSKADKVLQKMINILFYTRVWIHNAPYTIRLKCFRVFNEKGETKTNMLHPLLKLELEGKHAKTINIPP